MLLVMVMVVAFPVTTRVWQGSTQPMAGGVVGDEVVVVVVDPVVVVVVEGAVVVVVVVVVGAVVVVVVVVVAVVVVVVQLTPAVTNTDVVHCPTFPLKSVAVAVTLTVCPTLLHPIRMGEMDKVLTPHASVALATTCWFDNAIGADTVKGGLQVTTGAVLSNTVTGEVHTAEFPDWSNTVTVAVTGRPTLEQVTLVGV